MEPGPTPQAPPTSVMGGARERILIGDEAVSPEELDALRRQLPLLRFLARGNILLYIVLGLATALGLALFLVSYALVLDDVWRDLLREAGKALWTSVIVVLFIDVLTEVLRSRERRFVRMLEDVLTARGERLPPKAAAPDAEPETVDAKLDEILARLPKGPA